MSVIINVPTAATQTMTGQVGATVTASGIIDITVRNAIEVSAAATELQSLYVYGLVRNMRAQTYAPRSDAGLSTVSIGESGAVLAPIGSGIWATYDDPIGITPPLHFWVSTAGTNAVMPEVA